jgi:hypothetical protein
LKVFVSEFQNEWKVSFLTESRQRWNFIMTDWLVDSGKNMKAEVGGGPAINTTEKN